MITADVAAYLLDMAPDLGRKIESKGGTVTVNAEDNTVIVSIAGALGISRAEGEQWGAGLALGAAAAVNVSNKRVYAGIKGANVWAENSIDVDAESDSFIWALTAGGFGAGAKGEERHAVALAAGGAGSINVVKSEVDAEVGNKASLQTNSGRVKVSADDNAYIFANSVMVGAARAEGKTKAVGVALGGSFAVNVLDKEVGASIDSSTVKSARQVDVEARSTGVIWALTVGGVGAGGQVAQNTTTTNNTGNNNSNSQANNSFGGAFSIAGAGSVNVLDSEVEASIKASTVESGSAHDVSLVADDTSLIMANAGLLSVAVGRGDRALAVSLGASVAINKVTGGIKAFIEDSTITASGGLDLSAEANTTIWALTLGGVGAVGKGKDSYGLAFSGAGAGSVNEIERPIAAYISGDGGFDKTISTGSGRGVTVSAEDNALIMASAGVLSVAAGVGKTTGVGGSMGASVIVNVVKDSVAAYISGAKVSSAGGIDLDAESNTTVWALAVAGSVGVGVGKSTAESTGAGVAISGAVTVNVVDNRAASYIGNSKVITASNGAVSLDAQDKTLIMADAGGISIAVGVGGNDGFGLTIGGSVAVNVISNETSAYINGSTIGTANDRVGEVTLNADSDARVWALSLAGSLAVGRGENRFGGAVGFAVAGSVNVTRNTVEANISGGSTVNSTAALSIDADDRTRVIANGVGGSLSVGSGEKGLGVAVGGSFVVNDIGNTVRSHVSHSTLDVIGALDVLASSDSAIWGMAIGASVGVGAASGGGSGASISIGVSVSHNRIGNTTEPISKAPTACSPVVTMSRFAPWTMPPSSYCRICCRIRRFRHWWRERGRCCGQRSRCGSSQLHYLHQQRLC